MNERAPVSLALLHRFADVAAALLGRPVLPVRAKSVLYFGEADWHRDSELAIPSLGMAAYLEPLDADHGALRVRPGSHREPTGGGADDDGVALPTEPGDVIVFDEHLWHASRGGRDRRQWRVDFVIDPMGETETALVQTYFARTYRPDWDGGYDVDRYPTYGPRWRSSGAPWAERLRELGVYRLVDAEEAYARGRHSRINRGRAG
jgi:hypothetical protein